MTNPRKLNDVASDLEDVSVTIDEIREEEAAEGVPVASTPIDEIQAQIEKAVDIIDESLTDDGSEPRT